MLDGKEWEALIGKPLRIKRYSSSQEWEKASYFCTLTHINIAIAYLSH